MTLPAGEYRPLYEDDGGYYFQSPAQVILTSAGIPMKEMNAGLFVKRGSTEPTKWYLIEDNALRTGVIKNIPAYDIVP